jgi:hypothetical protein
MTTDFQEKKTMTPKIRIDVLTLDSVQCAACGYMMESIAALPEDIQALIAYREWSIKTKAGIGMFTKLKGKVLPTICIEKDLVFQSMIPQYEELIDALAERAPTDAIKNHILALRDKGFDFDNIKANLDRAGSGHNTRSDA